LSRSGSAYAPAFQFQRGDAGIRVKKPGRRAPLDMKRVLLALGLTALGFFAVHEAYRLVISWGKLTIRRVDLSCPDKTVGAEIDQTLKGIHWGNILLLDISDVRRRIESLPWVKSARIRKIFPSSVKIDVAVREPAAVLEKEGLILIDPEGVELGPAGPERSSGLPVLVDEGRFRDGAADKIGRARECLDAMTPEERSEAETLDLSDAGDVVLKFRSGPTRLKLGDELFGQRIALFRKMKDRWESELGPLEYVDLRFSDRVYVKTAGASPPAKEPLDSDKETR